VHDLEALIQEMTFKRSYLGDEAVSICTCRKRLPSELYLRQGREKSEGIKNRAFCRYIRGYRDHVWSKMVLIVGIFERGDARDDKMVKISRNEGI
jgi:hypothetical protein